eukprot:TRINITY_DN12898_c0_g1_i1.p1 TRINITY_DN12898_c0_g1~~TRINITY_DN12898_c0_g1_i1.p1  ORF type:complete len:197 (+),score=17.28 TRINITY_DN12898_c0_g1_i1:1-591(+)
MLFISLSDGNFVAARAILAHAIISPLAACRYSVPGVGAMPKTHMGWAKRSIEKAKIKEESDKKILDIRRKAVEALQKQQRVLEATRSQRPQAVTDVGLHALGQPTGPNLPRTRPSTDTHLGKVLSWNGRHGWIQPLQVLNLPQAGRHGGRIYVARQDIIAGGVMGAGLTPGQTCRFRLYTDASGIGAEQVEAVQIA